MTFAANMQHAIYWGRLKGFLAAEGVDVKVMITTSSTEQMRGLSKGTFQIASGSFDNVLGWSGREGAEIIAVAQGGDTTYFPIFANPEIKNWNDLRGKKLGVDAVDTAFSLVLRRVLLDKGLEFTKGDYQLVPVGGPSSELRRISRYYDNQYYDAATGR